MDLVAHFLGEREQEVAAIDGEHLDGDGLQQVPALVDLTDLLVHKLEAPVENKGDIW